MLNHLLRCVAWAVVLPTVINCEEQRALLEPYVDRHPPDRASVAVVVDRARMLVDALVLQWVKR